MNNETYAITEEQRVATIGKITDSDGFKYVYDLLASLPLITGEPAAFMFHTKDCDEIGGLAPLPSKRELLEIRQQGAEVIPLYTHAQPLQPITEADITEAMKEQFLKTPRYAASKDVFIAAVNAYLAAIAGEAT